MLATLEPLEIYRGATSLSKLDFTGFDFKGGYVLLTLKDTLGQVVKTQMIVEADKDIDNCVYIETTPDESLSIGIDGGLYDLMHIIESVSPVKRLPLCLASEVIVVETVGGIE